MKQTNIKQAKISDLTLDGHNANQGTQRGLGMLDNSLRKHGAGRSVLLDKKGKAIAGNKTIERAADIGIEDVIIVKTNGKQLVAVQREDLDLDDPNSGARELAYLDNRTGEAGLAWNPDVVLADFEAGNIDFSQLWNEQEWQSLLEGFGNDWLNGGGGNGREPEPQIDKAKELAEKWGTKVGQVWSLGEHRLAVGDCTDKAVVEAVMMGEKPILMVTDPPYGVEYDPGWRNEAAEKGYISYAASSIGNVPFDDRVDWSEAYTNVGAQVAYVWHADRRAKHTQESLERIGYEIVCQIIWAKPVFAISRGDYHWQHEPCWYAVKKGKTHNWQGSRSEATLWQIERGCTDKTGHGTEKPLECMARPIRNNSAIGDVVCDPFVGSGTTIIAGEQLKRKVRACEIDEGYAAVSIQRWVDLTGHDPRLVSG